MKLKNIACTSEGNSPISSRINKPPSASYSKHYTPFYLTDLKKASSVNYFEILYIQSSWGWNLDIRQMISVLQILVNTNIIGATYVLNISDCILHQVR